MNLCEIAKALKNGEVRDFKRTNHDEYYYLDMFNGNLYSQNDKSLIISLELLSADDWEFEAVTKSITKEQVVKAYSLGLTRAYGIIEKSKLLETPDNIFLEFLKELGFD